MQICVQSCYVVVESTDGFLKSLGDVGEVEHLPV